MPHVGSQDGQPESGYWSLPEPPTEQTLLYQIVDEYPGIRWLMAEQESELPGYVQRKLNFSMRAAGAWLSTGSLRVLPRQHLVAFGCASRFMPELWARRMAEVRLAG